MNASEKLIATLNFENTAGEGAVVETFPPWKVSVERWNKEGIPERFTREYMEPAPEDRRRRYDPDLPGYRYGSCIS